MDLQEEEVVLQEVEVVHPVGVVDQTDAHHPGGTMMVMVMIVGTVMVTVAEIVMIMVVMEEVVMMPPDVTVVGMVIEIAAMVGVIDTGGMIKVMEMEEAGKRYFYTFVLKLILRT